jgi:hypothetical protein
MLRNYVLVLTTIVSLPASSETIEQTVKITELLQEGFEIVAAHEFSGARIVYLQRDAGAFQCVIEDDLGEIKEWFKSDTSTCTMFSPLKKISD